MIKTLFSKLKTVECYFTPNDFKKAIICLAGMRAALDVDRGIRDYVEFSYSLESMVPQKVFRVTLKKPLLICPEAHIIMEFKVLVV